jgi:predicted AlkP superfamily phosphohydrolase/phosphomutase
MAKIITNKYEIFEMSTVYNGISQTLKITYFIKNEQSLYQSLCEIKPEIEFINWNGNLNKFEVNFDKLIDEVHKDSEIIDITDKEKIKEKVLNISELYTYMRDRKIDILFK